MLAVQDQPGENVGKLLVRRPGGQAQRGGDPRQGDGLARLRRHGGLRRRPRRRAVATGRRSCVSLARVLATEADVLLLDEPASGIDTKWVDTMLDLVEAVREQGRTVCIVEHNLHVVGAPRRPHLLHGARPHHGPGHDRRADQLAASWRRPTLELPDTARSAGRRRTATADAPLLVVENLQAGYGRKQVVFDVDLHVVRGRGRRHPRPQRQRQDAPRSRPILGINPAQGGRVTLRRPRRHPRRLEVQRQGGHGADPVRALRVPRPDRARQPAARRRQRARRRASGPSGSSWSTSLFPILSERADAARRHHVGRPAADGQPRPGADVGPEAADARRALARARARRRRSRSSTRSATSPTPRDSRCCCSSRTSARRCASSTAST